MPAVPLGVRPTAVTGSAAGRTLGSWTCAASLRSTLRTVPGHLAGAERRRGTGGALPGRGRSPLDMNGQVFGEPVERRPPTPARRHVPVPIAFVPPRSAEDPRARHEAFRIFSEADSGSWAGRPSSSTPR